MGHFFNKHPIVSSRSRMLATSKAGSWADPGIMIPFEYLHSAFPHSHAAHLSRVEPSDDRWASRSLRIGGKPDSNNESIACDPDRAFFQARERRSPDQDGYLLACKGMPLDDRRRGPERTDRVYVPNRQDCRARVPAPDGGRLLYTGGPLQCKLHAHGRKVLARTPVSRAQAEHSPRFEPGPVTETLPDDPPLSPIRASPPRTEPPLATVSAPFPYEPIVKVPEGETFHVLNSEPIPVTVALPDDPLLSPIETVGLLT